MVYDYTGEVRFLESIVIIKDMLGRDIIGSVASTGDSHIFLAFPHFVKYDSSEYKFEHFFPFAIERSFLFKKDAIMTMGSPLPDIKTSYCNHILSTDMLKLAEYVAAISKTTTEMINTTSSEISSTLH